MVMVSQPSILGIVTAAGRARRMGAAKALLAVRGRPMVVAVAAALIEGGVSEVVIVVNPQIAAALPSLPPGVRLVVNDDPDTPMIASVRLGLTEHERARGLGEGDGIAICPCDAAGLTAADVQRCIAAFHQHRDRIIIASHAGRRGHPLILPAALAAVVHSRECDGGLNLLARHRPQHVILVDCPGTGPIANVNTPADYERLQ